MLCTAEMDQLRFSVRRQTVGKVLHMMLDIFKVLKEELPAFAFEEVHEDAKPHQAIAPPAEGTANLEDYYDERAKLAVLEPSMKAARIFVLIEISGFTGKHVIDVKIKAKSFEVVIEEGSFENSFPFFSLSLSNFEMALGVWTSGMQLQVTTNFFQGFVNCHVRPDLAVWKQV